MPLAPGTWLNHYEILAHIGSGGMGEVYRARDNKLHREVALKVLPEHFARDPERVARFRREAQLLAQLNHPNIALIYNFEEAGETRFLVMELALGDTLRERIKRGPVPVEESLKISKQIAEALEHAHDKPIIHRDLKPANIKVTPAGVVKVLDFGLAKAFATAGQPVDPADIPTGSQHDTLKGTILGTPAYMSPEQASGREVDKRADIWSFGCVLYELLTGQWAFQSRDREGAVVPADTVQEIIARVLKSEPDWNALPESTPPVIAALLRRCLEKDAKRRLRDAADVAIQIEDTQAASSQVVVAPAMAKVAPPPPLWRRALPAVLTSLVTAAVAAGIAIWNRPASAPRPVTTAHFVISLSPGQQLADLGFNTVMALSPDGTRLAYVARSGNASQQIYIRSIDSPEARLLPGTEGAANPFFSPDGQWLGFSRPGKLEKISVSGGSPVTVFNSGGPLIGSGATWGADDTIVFQPSNIGDLWRVPAAGGEAQRLQNTLNLQKGLVASRWPEFLPGGNEVLFAAADNAANWYSPQLGIYRLNTGERRDLPQGGTRPRYAPTGHLLYVQNGTLMAVPFDPRRLEATGAQVPVGENVMQLRGGAAQYSLSDNGVLAYVQGFSAYSVQVTGNVQAVQSTLVWVDRKGTEQPVAAPPRSYRNPRLSPDARRIAINVEEPGIQLWMYDLTRETLCAINV